jgi:hypothetical protein
MKRQRLQQASFIYKAFTVKYNNYFENWQNNLKETRQCHCFNSFSVSKPTSSKYTSRKCRAINSNSIPHMAPASVQIGQSMN